MADGAAHDGLRHPPFPGDNRPVTDAHATPAPTLRRLAAPLGVLGGVVAAFAYVATVDPNTPGHYPVCPLLKYTGIYCPGCGGLRSAYAVAHGDFGAALGLNALAVAGYAAFAVFWVVWASRTARGRPFEVPLRPAYVWGVAAVVIAFTIVRNLPVGAVLAP
ncbi:MAG: hypothetical protein QOF84_1414 [Streptomyces sp.]|jgi:hypothetical protein|nr:hypothetical protein [Streptomyces sp.]MDX6346624.1 hypothetical protein [Streptomyces sp.]